MEFDKPRPEKRECKKMNWSYIAGFFDGEGHVDCKDKRVRLSFSNTHHETLLKIRQFLKVEHLKLYVKRGSKSQKDCYELKIADHRKVFEICKKIIQYSITKREKILEVLEYISNKKWQNHPLKTLSREDLVELYVTKKLSSGQIGKIFSVRAGAVIIKMKGLGIPRRSFREARIVSLENRRLKI